MNAIFFIKIGVNEVGKCRLSYIRKRKTHKPFTRTLYITVSDCLRARLQVLFILSMVCIVFLI